MIIAHRVLTKETPRRIFFFVFAITLITVNPAAAQRILLDRVIALVDDDVVLQSELDNRIRDIEQAAVRDGQTLPDAEDLESDILEALIIENIQLQMAEQVSIRYDDDTINRVLGNMADNSNMSFDELKRLLIDIDRRDDGDPLFFNCRDEELPPSLLSRGC